MLKEIVVLVWTAIACAAALICLPGSVELLLLIIGSVLPKRRERNSLSVISSDREWRVAVIVPAHNEAANIKKTIRSLGCATRKGFSAEVVVIADNCTDSTASIAASNGARVLVREDAVRRGKGFALDHAFTTLETEGFDAYLVVDADTEVARDFLTKCIRAFQTGAEAVQARYLLSNPDDSVRTRLTSIANRAFNVLRARGRERLGLSCGVYGNGFGITRATLAEVPYLSSSIVEDLEYHLALVRAGKKIRFVEETSVYGETPSAVQAARSQKTRWEGGRFRMIREKSPGLLLDVCRGKLVCFEPLLDLLLLPLTFHTALLGIAAAAPLASVRFTGIAGLVLVVIHLLLAIAQANGSLREATALLAAPFYILWKLLLLPGLARGSKANSDWVRTERNVERRVS